MRQTVVIKQVTLLMAAMLTFGCQGVPVGSSGGRVDSYRTTAADRGSTRANIASLLEFSDIAAGRLILDMPNIAAINDSNSKPILELGTIANNTQTPTGDFELMLTRLRSKLLKSDVIRKHFTVVMSRSRMQIEQDRTGATGEQPAAYDANLTYILQGDFHEAVRESRRQFYFQVTLTHLTSREIVFQDDYDLGQMVD